MDNLLFFVVGGLITYLILQKPLQIHIRHTHEDITPKISKVELNELEQQMLKPDQQNDNLYDDLTETITEVNNIMGGSDRQ